MTYFDSDFGENLTPFLFVFDDQELFVKPFSRQLRRTGFRVHSAKDRKRALSLVKTNSYNAYCIDIHADWDYTFGLELISKIRARNPNSYIDIVSGHPQYKETLNKIGADHFTDKPIEYKEYANSLLKTIRNKMLVDIGNLDFSFKKDTLDDYITNILKVLESEPEIKYILLEIFGKEIPEIRHRVKELEKLNAVSQSYLKGSDRILKIGHDILREN